MRNHSRLFGFSVIVTCFIVASCASIHTPKDWLPEVEDINYFPYGGWVEVEGVKNNVMGELIAVGLDTLFVADTTFHAIPMADIHFVRLVTYHGRGVGTPIILGAISTVFLNGLYAGVTFPMWVIGGIIVGSSKSFEPIIDYPAEPLRNLTPFARFPQGMPEVVDRDKLVRRER